MTLEEVIRRVDGLCCNAFSREEKEHWLRELEGSIVLTLVDTHRDPPELREGELTAPEPFAGLYLRWLEAQIHYHNGETDRYNGAITLFNTQFSQFESWYNRTHAPRGKGIFR